MQCLSAFCLNHHCELFHHLRIAKCSLCHTFPQEVGMLIENQAISFFCFLSYFESFIETMWEADTFRVYQLQETLEKHVHPYRKELKAP